MYSIEYTKRFEKDLKRCLKRGLDIELIKETIQLLADIGLLPASFIFCAFVVICVLMSKNLINMAIMFSIFFGHFKNKC